MEEICLIYFGGKPDSRQVKKSNEEVKRQIKPLLENYKIRPLDELRSTINDKNKDLMELRYLIESNITKILDNCGYGKQRFRSLANGIRLLEQENLLDKNAVNLIREVIHLCNKAIHGNIITQREHTFVMEISNNLLIILQKALEDSKLGRNLAKPGDFF